MDTRIKLNIHGQVELLVNKETIYKEKNNIAPDALQIITRSLAKLPNEVNVDEMEIIGNFDTISIPIMDSQYNTSTGSITFIGFILPNQAVGTITGMKLKSGLLDLALATKAGLTIEKDDSTEIEIRWKITITSN